MIDELVGICVMGDVEIKNIPAIRDKKISILRGKERDDNSNRSYLRTMMILVGDEIVASNYADSILFLSELRLFDKGNDQNKFFKIEKKNNICNLRLQSNISKKKIYVTKAEAEAFCRIFNDAKLGVSMTRILEEEFLPTLEQLAELLGAE